MQYLSINNHRSSKFIGNYLLVFTYK